MATWLWLAAGVLLAAYLALWVYTRRARSLLTGLPTYPQLPFIGNLLHLYGGGENLFHRVNEISAISEEKGKPFLLWVGPVPAIICHDPGDVRMIVNNLIEKPYYYNFGKIWLGDGLVTAPASLWKHNVKKLSGVFSTTVVDNYQQVFNAKAQILVEDLKKKVGAEPFDVMHHLSLTTLEAICQTALGVTQISNSIQTKQYYEAFTRILELFISRGLNLLTHLDCVYKLTPAYKELVKNVGVLHNVSDVVLRNRKIERGKIKKSGPNGKTEDPKFRSVLDIILDISESDPLFTEQQIKSEVDTIILGGQETVASTLFYALLMIGSRPDVQDKLYVEMRNIFGSSNRPAQKEDLARMQYCEAVINETLRLFPPLPVVMRYADKELKLKSCTVPIGTGCAINVWGAGRSERTWGHDALEYRPSRWLTGEPTTAAAFLPFSYGRRSCIGKKYAMAIMKTILAHCVRELEFTSEADRIKFKIDVVLKAVSGHLIQVKLRK